MVTSTEGFSLGDPSVKAPPIDTSKVVWGKAEQVVKAGVDARKGNAVVLTVADVLDGDTVKLKDGAAQGISKGVCRVDGIDAQETSKSWKQPPEPGQPYGDAAKKELSRLIDQKEVSVTITKAKDAYGRSVCQIDLQGANVSAEMVKAGAAFLTEKYWKDSPESVQQVGQREALRVFQKEALSSGKGMGALPKEQQVLPKTYRDSLK